MSKQITIETGDGDFVIPTSKNTLREIVSRDFTEDYNVPSGAIFQLNGEDTSLDTAVEDGDIIGWVVPTSSKA